MKDLKSKFMLTCNLKLFLLEGHKFPSLTHTPTFAHHFPSETKTSPFHLHGTQRYSWCCYLSNRLSVVHVKCQFYLAGKWHSEYLSSLSLWALWPAGSNGVFSPISLSSQSKLDMTIFPRLIRIFAKR